MQERFKVGGKTGTLGPNTFNITRSGGVITFESQVHFSKRYLKYLAKKFMKKNQLREWIRVVSSDKTTYQLRYYNVNQDEEVAEETTGDD